MRCSEAIAGLKSTYAILAADVEEVVAYGKRNPSEFAHRTLLRTHFALVEGLTLQMSAVAVAAAEDAPRLFSSQEIALLRQERYSLSNSGTPESRPQFPHALPSLRFAIDCFARVYGARFAAKYDDSGWQAMEKLASVRNRLTHPKNQEDLHLTENDLRNAVAGAEWFKQTTTSLFDACTRANDAYGGDPGRTQQSTQPPKSACRPD